MEIEPKRQSGSGFFNRLLIALLLITVGISGWRLYDSIADDRRAQRNPTPTDSQLVYAGGALMYGLLRKQGHPPEVALNECTTTSLSKFNAHNRDIWDRGCERQYEGEKADGHRSVRPI